MTPAERMSFSNWARTFTDSAYNEPYRRRLGRGMPACKSLRDGCKTL